MIPAANTSTGNIQGTTSCFTGGYNPFLKMVIFVCVNLHHRSKDQCTHFIPPNIKSFLIRLYKRKDNSEHTDYLIYIVWQATPSYLCCNTEVAAEIISTANPLFTWVRNDNGDVAYRDMQQGSANASHSNQLPSGHFGSHAHLLQRARP